MNYIFGFGYVIKKEEVKNMNFVTDIIDKYSAINLKYVDMNKYKQSIYDIYYITVKLKR